METFALKINRRVKEIVGSTTLAITARAKELQAQGRDVVNFAAGEPDFDTPTEIKQAAMRAIEKGFTKYTPTLGTKELKEAIAAKFKKDNVITYQANQIAVSCGAKHSIFNIIQVLADEGDEVLIPSPYWVSYPEMVKIAGATPKILPTTAADHFKITKEQLEENITENTKILILNSPSNPTGMVYSDQELKKIAEVVVRKNIFVISDDIYEKLIYDIPKFTSIASLGKEIYDLTITVNGVSKAYSMTGWRIGYCAGPPEIIDYINKYQDHSTSNPTSISQMAALEALRSSEQSILKMQEEFQKRRDVMMAALDEIPKIRYIRPEGAFYVFCDISRLGDSLNFSKRILDEINVAVIPGDGFGASGYVRLSFATSLEKIKEGMKRLSPWVNHFQEDK